MLGIFRVFHITVWNIGGQRNAPFALCLVDGTLTGLVSPLGMPGQIIYGMVVIGAWRDMGYTMLIYIAALQAVPQDYYEAATVDGAGKLRQFFSVTVPNIVPAPTPWPSVRA